MTTLSCPICDTPLNCSGLNRTSLVRCSKCENVKCAVDPEKMEVKVVRTCPGCDKQYRFRKKQMGGLIPCRNCSSVWKLNEELDLTNYDGEVTECQSCGKILGLPKKQVKKPILCANCKKKQGVTHPEETVSTEQSDKGLFPQESKFSDSQVADRKPKPHSTSEPITENNSVFPTSGERTAGETSDSMSTSEEIPETNSDEKQETNVETLTPEVDETGTTTGAPSDREAELSESDIEGQETQDGESKPDIKAPETVPEIHALTESPKSVSPNSPRRSIHAKKVGRGQKIAVFLSCVLMVVALCSAAVVLLANLQSRNTRLASNPVETEPTKTKTQPKTTKTRKNVIVIPNERPPIPTQGELSKARDRWKAFTEADEIKRVSALKERFWNENESALVAPTIARYSGHSKGVGLSAFSTDGQFLVSTDGKGNLHIRTLPDGQTKITLNIHKSPITALTMEPETNRIACGDMEGNVHLIRPDGKQAETIPLFSQSIQALAYGSAGKLYVGGPGILAAWDPKTKTHIWSPYDTSVGNLNVNYMVVSEPYQMLITASPTEVSFRNILTGELFKRLPVADSVVGMTLDRSEQRVIIVTRGSLANPVSILSVDLATMQSKTYPTVFQSVNGMTLLPGENAVLLSGMEKESYSLILGTYDVENGKAKTLIEWPLGLYGHPLASRHGNLLAFSSSLSPELLLVSTAELLDTQLSKRLKEISQWASVRWVGKGYRIHVRRPLRTPMHWQQLRSVPEVVSLDLRYTVAPDKAELAKWTKLTNLLELNLDGVTKTDGSILETIPSLVQLQRLHLQDLPDVTGKQLAGLQKLKSLKVLDLKNVNGLTNDTLPILKGCKQLRVLNLSGTPLKSPDLRMFADYPNLKELHMNDVTLGDAKNIVMLPTMKRLRVLSLRNTGISALKGSHPFPESLKVLDLGGNRSLEVDVFTALKGLKELGSLHLDSTNSGDNEIANLAGLPLTKLNLSFTKVTDAGLTHLSGLKKLTQLDLQGIKGIKGEGFRHLHKLDNLRLFNAEGTNISNESLAHLAKMQRLEGLTLPEQIGNDGLKYIGAMNGLKYLSLAKTDTDDSGLNPLTNLKNLEVLDLSHTKVGDAGMAILAKLTALQEVIVPDSVTAEATQVLRKRDIRVFRTNGKEISSN